MMIQTAEMYEMAGVAAVWSAAGLLMLAGYALSRRIRRRQFVTAYEPEVTPSYDDVISEYQEDAAQSAVEHEAWQIANWKRVPHLDQLRCTSVLWRMIPTTTIDKWVKQKAAGEAIGSDDFGFHYSSMARAIRRELRAALPDNRLPAVVYPSGEIRHEWDDFYRGALNDMIEQAVVAYKVGAAA